MTKKHISTRGHIDEVFAALESAGLNPVHSAIAKNIIQFRIRGPLEYCNYHKTEILKRIGLETPGMVEAVNKVFKNVGKMKLTPYQTEIIAFVSGIGEATSAELVSAFGCRTPYAPNKYVGLALSRMVNAGLLIRVKKGLFKVGTGIKSKPATIAEGQPELF